MRARRHVVMTSEFSYSSAGCALLEMTVALLILSIICLSALNFFASPLPMEHVQQSSAVETASGILNAMYAVEFEPSATIHKTEYPAGSYLFDGDGVVPIGTFPDERALLPLPFLSDAHDIRYQLAVKNAVAGDPEIGVRIAVIDLYANRAESSENHAFCTLQLLLPP